MTPPRYDARQKEDAALLEQPDARPLSLVKVLKFGPDGRREDFIIAGRASIRLRGARARGRGVGGNAKCRRLKASIAQKRLRAATSLA